MGRTEMSKEELRKVEVLARVKSGALRVKDAAGLLGLSYRQAKRLWKRYRQEGAAGMKHGSAGRHSNRAYAASLRGEVLERVRNKYSGEWASVLVPPWRLSIWSRKTGCKSMRRRCGAGCWRQDCGRGSGGGGGTGGGGSARSTLGSWCRWTEASTPGWKSVVREVA